MAVAEQWRDASGVVHVVGMLPGTNPIVPITTVWRTHCYIIPIVSVSEIVVTSCYTTDAPTCLVCIVKARE